MADDVVALWEERRKTAERGRKRYERAWKIAHAFFANDQWIGWDKRQNRVVALPNPQERPRYTINVIPKYVARYQGKLVPDDLRPDVTFRREDLESESVADESRRGLEYAWDEEARADTRFREVSRKRLLYGIGGTRVRWDPTFGENKGRYPIGPDGKAIANATDALAFTDQQKAQGLEVKYKDVNEGRITLDSFGPFNMLPPPAIEHERDFPWFILNWPVAVEDLKLVYGAAADGIDGERLYGVQGVSTEIAGGGEEMREHALLYIGFQRPTRDHPNGREVHWAQGQKLRVKEQLPYRIDGEWRMGINFFKFDVVDGRFWPIGLVEPMIGPQRQMNGMRSGAQESIDRGGWQRVFADKGWYSEVNRPRGVPFEIIEGNPGTRYPQETQGVGPGSWIRDEYELSKADMDMVAGLRSDATQAPGGTTAYAAFNFFNEQEEQAMGEIRKADREGLKEIAELILDCIGTYWVGDKLLSVTSQDDGLMDKVIYDAAKLPARRYVKLSKSAPISQTPAAESQKIMDVFDRGISSGQTLPLDWLFSSLIEGRALPLPKREAKVQQDKAEYENLMIAQGMQVRAAPHDNHQLHVTIHRAGQTANEVGQRPDVAAAIEMHIQEHLMMQQAAAAQAAPSNNGQQPQPGAGTGGQNAGNGPAAAAAAAGAVQQPVPSG